jgi:hypothetical protein
MLKNLFVDDGLRPITKEWRGVGLPTDRKENYTSSVIV